MSMLDRKAIESFGFAHIGENVQISDRASIYGIKNIRIGNNVRIDDFCVLSAGMGGIEIGNHVHIGVGSTLIGKGKISLSDFANISSRVAIYSSNDDYSGESLTNPTIPEKYKNVFSAPVAIGRHAIIGCGAIILPGVIVGEGAAIGALSLVTRSCDQFCIYAGNPAKKINERKKKLLDLEKVFIADSL